MNDEHEWVHGEQYNYNPDRWDPDERPSKCMVCGTWLRGAGGGWTLGQYCPECEVNVWIK